MTGAPGLSSAELDQAIARLLTIGTYASVALLALGVGLMALSGHSPLGSGVQPFDLRRLPVDLAAGRPEGFLWLGLLAVIATPSSRVAASLVAYARTGERRMVLVALGILAVIGTSVAIGLATAAGSSG